MDKIVFVDGFKIRNTLDDDFGIIECHFTNIFAFDPKFWIPEGEIWVDHRYRDEADYLNKASLFRIGISADERESYAERREKMRIKFCVGQWAPENIHKSELRGDLTIRYVDGGAVRKCFDVDFAFGGHDLVYDYIPQREIWIDDKIDPNEIPFILLHEETERKLIEEGKPYHIAHEYATIADKDARRANGASYPGDPNYPWYSRSNEEIIKNYYVL